MFELPQNKYVQNTNYIKNLFKEHYQMRKKKYLKNIGVLLTDEQYEQLVQITDKLEVTLSGYLRDLVEKELRENQKEEYQNE